MRETDRERETERERERERERQGEGEREKERDRETAPAGPPSVGPAPCRHNIHAVVGPLAVRPKAARLPCAGAADWRVRGAAGGVRHRAPTPAAAGAGPPLVSPAAAPAAPFPSAAVPRPLRPRHPSRRPAAARRWRGAAVAAQPRLPPSVRSTTRPAAPPQTPPAGAGASGVCMTAAAAGPPR